VFPAPELDVIDAATLRSCLFYKRDDSANEESRDFFEKYIDELSARQGALWIIAYFVLTIL
jgi:hypothetical protein